jgi:parvulin-like peptidyl-prolyl isomerase
MRALILLVALFASFSAPASAGEEVAAAQAVIRSQIEAISHDDAVAAYSFAAPPIRRVIADAETFLAIVREHYVPIYRHKAFQFGEASVSDGKIAQEVHIIDADGLPWEGLYTLDQQPDGGMKISGCVLTKAPSQPI